MSLKKNGVEGLRSYIVRRKLRGMRRGSSNREFWLGCDAACSSSYCCAQLPSLTRSPEDGGICRSGDVGCSVPRFSQLIL